MTRLLDFVVYTDLDLDHAWRRAAANTKENFILFTALALTAHLAGLSEQATAGVPCSSGRG